MDFCKGKILPLSQCAEMLCVLQLKAVDIAFTAAGLWLVFLILNVASAGSLLKPLDDDSPALFVELPTCVAPSASVRLLIRRRHVLVYISFR